MGRLIQNAHVSNSQPLQVVGYLRDTTVLFVVH